MKTEVSCARAGEEQKGQGGAGGGMGMVVSLVRQAHRSKPRPPTLGLWPRCLYPSSRLLPTMVLPPRTHHPAHFTEVAAEALRLSPTREPEPCFGKAPTGFGQQLLRPPGCSRGAHSGARWGSRLPPEQLNLLPLGPSVGLWPQPWSQLTQRPL